MADKPHSYTIWIPTVREEYLLEIKKLLPNQVINRIDVVDKDSFSSLCNKAINATVTDYVIVIGDKARPKPRDISRMVDLLEEGHGLVGLFRFGFFGMHVNLAKEVGGFDERFIDGGYEDNDILIKMKQYDVAVYIDEEIEYISGVPSLWPQVESKKFFHKKYKLDFKKKLIIQNIPHEKPINSLIIKNRNFQKFENSFLGWIPLEHPWIDFALILETYDTQSEIGR